MCVCVIRWTTRKQERERDGDPRHSLEVWRGCIQVASESGTFFFVCERGSYTHSHTDTRTHTQLGYGKRLTVYHPRGPQEEPVTSAAKHTGFAVSHLISSSLARPYGLCVCVCLYTVYSIYTCKDGREEEGGELHAHIKTHATGETECKNIEAIDLQPR